MHCHDCSRKFSSLIDIIARRADFCPRQALAKVNRRRIPQELFQIGQQFQEIKLPGVRLLMNFGWPAIRRMFP
jgi:hypothetical protein